MAPSNVVDGQSSGRFVAAVALRTGKMDWDSYRLLDDPEIRALMPRIDCVNDPGIEAEFPANMAGKLTLRAHGETFTRSVIVLRGKSVNFPDEAAFRAKFHGLADAVGGVYQSKIYM